MSLADVLDGRSLTKSPSSGAQAFWTVVDALQAPFSLLFVLQKDLRAEELCAMRES